MVPDEWLHRPVLLSEAVDGLALEPADFAVDCTFGRGGHSSMILAGLGDNGRLLALDKDPDALGSTEARALRQDSRLTLVHTSFTGLRREVEQLGWYGQVSAVLMDLGVSSPQLDKPERGFSFSKSGPLDMRMDTTEGMTAADWLATVGEQSLAGVLQDYGEERFARRIAREIVRKRLSEPLLTTRDLARLIESVVPFREKGKHPATRSFQAIRIYINRELSELEAGLAQALDVLKPGGRLAVIAFHSLEDRIVKRFMRDAERGFTADQARQLLQPDPVCRIKRIGRPVLPGAAELALNVRARSAVLRIAEKIK